MADNTQNTAPEVATEPKIGFLHKIFGSKPGDGEMQPKEGLLYSVCGFGQNLICTIIGSYLTVFMTDAIGFSAIAVALLMLFARIFDAANDPIMGSIVDRTRTKWGKCRPYLKWMAFPIALMTILCFLPVFPNNPGGFAAISIVYIIWGIVYTVADVPYWALSTAMSNDTYRRGNMLTIARLFCTAGAGIVTVVVPMITNNMTAEMTSDMTLMQNVVNSLNGVQFQIDKFVAGAAFNPEEWRFVLSELNPSNFQSYIANIQTTYIDSGLIIGDALTDLNNAIASLNNAIVELGKYTIEITDGSVLQGVSLVDVSSLQAAMDALSVSVKHDLSWIYFIAAIICAGIGLPLFFVGFKSTKERNISTAPAPSLKHNLKLLFKNKPLMLIVLSGIGGAARSLFVYTGGLYFAKYVLADVVFIPGLFQGESLYSLFTFAVVPGGLISSLLVPYLTKKFGKRNTYIVSHIIGGVAMLIALVVGLAIDKGNYTNIATIAVLAVALVIAGFPGGFSNILTYAMIGDTVEYLELKTGERAEGICFAMQTLINKIGMAVGAFIGVMAYMLANVEANNPAAVQPGDKDTMWIILVGVSALSYFLTIIPLFFYKFNEKQQQEAKEEINRRKLALANADGGEVALDEDGNPIVADEAVDTNISADADEQEPTQDAVDNDVDKTADEPQEIASDEAVEENKTDETEE